MTTKEKVICMAYTGVSFLPGDELDKFYKYAEEKLGEPLWTHEFADPKLIEDLHEKSHDDFMDVLAGKYNAERCIAEIRLDYDILQCAIDEGIKKATRAKLKKRGMTNEI